MFQQRRARSFRRATNLPPLQLKNFLPVRAAPQDRRAREQKVPADNSTSWSVPRSAHSRQRRLIYGQESRRPRQTFSPRQEIRPPGLFPSRPSARLVLQQAVRFFLPSHVRFQELEAFFTLTPSNDLADSRNQ